MNAPAESLKTAVSKSDGQVCPPLAPTFALWAPIIAGSARLSTKTREGLAVLGSEWLQFADRRLKEDLQLLQRLSGCRSPVEVSMAYLNFWQCAAADYQNEFLTMARLSAAVINNNAAAQRGAWGRASETTPPALTGAA